MKVKLLTSISGPDINVGFGGIVDMADDEAARFIAANMAVPARDEEGAENTSAKKDAVEFAKLSKADIVSKAAEVHGLELDPAMKKSDMLAAIDEHLASATGSNAIPAKKKSE